MPKRPFPPILRQDLGSVRCAGGDARSGRAGRGMLAAAVLLGLAGCAGDGTTSPSFSGLFGGPAETTASVAPASGPVAATEDPASSGAAMLPTAFSNPAEKAAVESGDPLAVGKYQYRAARYGLAEVAYRKAVELAPRDAEAWIGMAATYDRLRRFDLADRAYAQAIKLSGETAAILNNRGFSYMLRGDYKAARRTLEAARAKDPGNPTIQANLDLMSASLAYRQAAR